MTLDHVAIIVSKIENLDFYEKLGFKESKRITRKNDVIVFMEYEGINLEVFVDSNHPERVIRPEARGLRHIAFLVENLNCIDIEYEEIYTDWFGRKAMLVKDYDGQPIELIEKRGIEI